MTMLGAPFLAFGALAVKSFADSQDALAQLDAVLKSTTTHNGEWATSTAMSADDLDKLSGKLSDATDKLNNMQTVYDSNTKHTVAQNLALEDQKQKVADLSSALAAGNTQISTMTNVTHMSRDALIALSKELQSVTRFSDETVMSAENMLLTFTNIGKEVFPDATKATLDMAQALGTDAKSAAMQLGKALSSYSGVTALKRMGVQFSQSQLDILKSLFESNRAMDAQKIILKELSTEFGGSAVAAGQTFAGQMERVKNQLDDVMEGIGEKLIPFVTELINHIVDLANWFSNLDSPLQNIIIGIGVFMASLAIIGPIIAAIGVGISAVGGILAVVFSPIGLIIGGVVAALAGLYLAFQSNFLGIRDFLQPIFDKITGFFSNFNDNVKLYGSLIKLFAEYYFQGVVEAIQKIINKIVEFLVQNPKLVEAIVVVGGVLLVLGGVMLASAGLTAIFTGAMSALGVVVSAGSTLLTGIGSFIALLTGPIGLVALLIALVGAVMIAYPGGFPGLLKDAAASFVLLVKTVDVAFLTWIKNLAQEFHNLAVVLGLATDARGRWEAGGSSGFGGGAGFGSGTGALPIPPVGGGSAAPLPGGVGMPHMDFGGRGRAGGAYMIGRGAQPEVFIPSSNGTFIPNADKAMGGNVVNLQSLVINANDAAGGAAAGNAFIGVLDEWQSRGNR